MDAINRFLIRLTWTCVVFPLRAIDSGIYRLRQKLRRYGGEPPLPPREIK
jgi:hypothetical protein